MRILKIKFDDINLFKNGLTVDFVARDKVTDNNYVYKFDRHFATQNTIVLIGANATGKTSALRLMRMAMEIVLNQQSIKNIAVPKGLVNDNTKMTVDFFDKTSNSYFRLESIFKYAKQVDETDQIPTLRYFEETLYKKDTTKVGSKSQIDIFEDLDICLTREKLKDQIGFLRDDDSILFYAIERNDANRQISHSMIDENMINFYRVSGNANMVDINIFDDSIYSLAVEDSQIKVKFKNNDMEQDCSAIPNQNYLLSSGTAKGGNILFWLKAIIRKGGYLVVDELENHFHKKLVEFIIDLFNDETINRNGATLVFSTHYAEILDNINRKDNIYVLIRNDDYVTDIVKYSEVIKRIENKKSEVFLSNYIKGTSPSFRAIKNFKDSIWN